MSKRKHHNCLDCGCQLSAPYRRVGLCSACLEERGIRDATDDGSDNPFNPFNYPHGY